MPACRAVVMHRSSIGPAASASSFGTFSSQRLRSRSEPMNANASGASTNRARGGRGLGDQRQRGFKIPFDIRCGAHLHDAQRWLFEPFMPSEAKEQTRV